jgi:hypothetical protein
MKVAFINSTFIILLILFTLLLNANFANSSSLPYNTSLISSNSTTITPSNLKDETKNVNLPVNTVVMNSTVEQNTKDLNLLIDETKINNKSNYNILTIKNWNNSTIQANNKDSVHLIKIEDISKNIQAFDTYKYKIEVLKSKIEKKIPSIEISKFNLKNDILISSKQSIMFLCFLILCLMFALVLRISFYNNKSKHSNFLHNESKNANLYYDNNKSNADYCMINLAELSDNKKEDELREIELKGRTLKVPPLEAMFYNLNNKPAENKNFLQTLSNKSSNIDNNRLFNEENFKPIEKFNSLNLESRMITALKNNIISKQNKSPEIQLSCIKENNEFPFSFSKINKDCGVKSAYEFSFGLDTSQNNFNVGTGKFNLNDTVDYEEREEYANIICSLGI